MSQSQKPTHITVALDANLLEPALASDLSLDEWVRLALVTRAAIEVGPETDARLRRQADLPHDCSVLSAAGDCSDDGESPDSDGTPPGQTDR